MKHCSYCGKQGHDADDCRWPRWHARRDSAFWAPLWLRIICWLYLPFGIWLILQQVAKLGSAP